MTPGLIPSRLDTRGADSATSRDRRLELCDLCGRRLFSTHRHMLHAESRSLLCACPACALQIDERNEDANDYRLATFVNGKTDQN